MILLKPVTDTKLNKLILLLALLLVFSATVAVSYPAFEGAHECHDEECPICMMLEICEGTVRIIGAGTFAVLLVSAFVFIGQTGMKPAEIQCPVLNLITGKVRLND